jgi:hemolysin-activating ACP:hemolysin acyltransferase
MGLFSNKGEKTKQADNGKTETADVHAKTAAQSPKTADAAPASQTDIAAPVQLTGKTPPDDRVVEARFTVYGKILSILGRQKPFVDMPLGQIAAMVGPAVDAGLFAIADGQPKDQSGPAMPIAFIIWARVSAEVDKKLSENLQEMVTLTPQDWTSGDIHWLLLSVGPQQAVGAILKTVSQKLPPGQNFKTRFADKDGQQKVGFVSVEERTPPA